YAESGGQVGDSGKISGNAEITVADTKKTQSGIFTHNAKIVSGTVCVGDKVTAQIDTVRRAAIRRNHTAAHLLQAALREVLGTHVQQAGSMVNESVVRFDFTHFSALTAEELAKVEEIINTNVLDAIAVDNREMPIEEAKKLGAMALFGEKYGDTVRVVKIEDKSIEFCGGTHVANTGNIGLFKVLSESSVAAGVRRIEAVTGFNSLALINAKQALIDETAATLKTGNSAEIASRAAQVMAESKENEKKIEQLEAKIAMGKLDDILKNKTVIGSAEVITAAVENSGADEIRSIAEKVKSENENAVVLLIAKSAEKITLCAAAGKSAIAAGIKAGEIVSGAAKLLGGNGGGRPDIAMAGGKDASKIGEALAFAVEFVKEKIGG
ncbi:MAG: alanine--tRNA ligase, partial [Clostridia bacterium]|nr:alanine--tRNA ligase [Clostridia bacterium]